MKERSKDRRAELLLGELFEQLAERENVKAMLGDLTALPLDEVVDNLLNDFELAIARRQVEALRSKVSRQEKLTGEPEPPAPVAPAPTKAEPPTPPVVAKNPELVFHASKPAAVPPAPAAKKKEGTTPAPVPQKPIDTPRVPVKEEKVHHEPPAPLVEQEPKAPQESEPPTFWEKLEQEIKSGPLSDHGSSFPSTPSESIRQKHEMEEEETEEDSFDDESPVLSTASSKELRSPCTFTDDDDVYVHAVTFIPDHEQSSATPFMLEEKGINLKEFAFAFDYEGLRFYLSKVPPSLSLSKVGMLLLSKQESLELRGVHESILNDLRLHGILLPFEFGTIARGKDKLIGKIDKCRDKLLDAIDRAQATKWWMVSLLALDAKIAQLVGKDDTASSRTRTIERTSYSKTPATKKYDIKLLERMLSKEKKLAESVHEELKKHASRSDIDMMVGLGSGSSEDWKPILKASYEAPGPAALKLFRGITDQQYHHMMFDLMFSVTCDAEPFVFEVK